MATRPADPELPEPVEWCLYGAAWGTYTFECASSARAMLAKYKREDGGGSRIIRTIEGPHHTHDGSGRCIPKTVTYRTHAARQIGLMIGRSMLAGNQPIFY